MRGTGKGGEGIGRYDLFESDRSGGHQLLSKYLPGDLNAAQGGKLHIRVLSRDAEPQDGFVPAEPTWRMFISAILPPRGCEYAVVQFKSFFMFIEIFLFEIRSRVRRPAVYFISWRYLPLRSLPFPPDRCRGRKGTYQFSFPDQFLGLHHDYVYDLVSSSVMGTAVFRISNTRPRIIILPILSQRQAISGALRDRCLYDRDRAGNPASIWLGSHLGPAIGKTVCNTIWTEQADLLFACVPVAGLPNILFTSTLFYGWWRCSECKSDLFRGLAAVPVLLHALFSSTTIQ